MSGLVNTIYLPGSWDQSTHELNSGMNESIDESLRASAEEKPSVTDDAVSLPPETLVEIAALNDEELLDQRKTSVGTEICDLEKQVAQMERSVEELSSAVISIEDEISSLKEQLAGKQHELNSVLIGLKESKRNYVLKTQEFSALEHQEKTIRARQLFDAFIVSGKTMEEILSFLHGEPESDKLQEGESLPDDSDEVYNEGEMMVQVNADPEDSPLPIAVEDEFSADDRDVGDLSNPADVEGQPQTISYTSKIVDEKQPRKHVKKQGRRSAFVLVPDLEDEFNAMWEKIESMQGQTFYTMRGLPFQYEVRGRQIFVNRKGKAITESSLRISFHQAKTGSVIGPHSLKTFGASYVWSIFKTFGIIADEDKG